jgi:hypothetical protein
MTFEQRRINHIIEILRVAISPQTGQKRPVMGKCLLLQGVFSRLCPTGQPTVFKYVVILSAYKGHAKPVFDT